MEYVKAAEKEEFRNKNHKTLKLLGRLVGIIKRNDGSFFAREINCKHQGADLLADYQGGTIACCPRHGWKYDLESGKCLSNDSPSLKKYGLKTEGEKILVTLLPLRHDE
ncbi:MAG: Rieske (2Fe-2S) protein [Desulfocapsaceae bacterium]|jgi:nitrite reductase/ring-hydroxylating ferredoxin subunit|nr:Rieske (2Fe-2S) protein [Desulfocapsaceae bacterium]